MIWNNDVTYFLIKFWVKNLKLSVENLSHAYRNAKISEGAESLSKSFDLLG